MFWRVMLERTGVHGLGQLRRDGRARAPHVVERHDLVEEPGGHRLGRRAEVGVLHTTGEPGLRQPVPAQLHAEGRHRHPDRDLVQPDLVVALRPDPVVRGGREDAAHRQRVTGDTEDDRDPEGVDAQRRAGRRSPSSCRAPSIPPVMTLRSKPAENFPSRPMRATADASDSALGQRVVQAVEDGEGQRVRLAVVEGDDGDITVVRERYGISHARTVPAGPARVDAHGNAAGGRHRLGQTLGDGRADALSAERSRDAAAEGRSRLVRSRRRAGDPRRRGGCPRRCPD